MSDSARHAPPSKMFVQSWQRFWHPDGSTLSLGLFRIVFAYCLFSEAPITELKSRFAIEGWFHLPYPFVPSFIHPVSEQTFHLMQTLQYPLILCLALGLFMRPAIIGLLALQGYVFCSDAMNFRNHPYFFLLALLLLLFSPADESVSFKSLRRIYSNSSFSIDALIGPIRPLTSQRLIMVQICLIYFLAGVQKINPAFLDGRVLGDELSSTVQHWGRWGIVLPWGNTVIQLQDVMMTPNVLMAASIATLLLELVLPVTLWFPRTRVASFIAGIGFHLFIGFLMGISQFSIAMIGGYFLFLEPETLPALASRLGHHWKTPGENTRETPVRGQKTDPPSSAG
jgi:HTTM domain